MSEWQLIDTAPKDGTWILAYGNAYPELTERGSWSVASIEKPRVPFTMLIRWRVSEYDKEIDNGDGTYRKQRTVAYESWIPEPHAFTPTHWMPLPDPPVQHSRAAGSR